MLPVMASLGGLPVQAILLASRSATEKRERCMMGIKSIGLAHTTKE